MAKENLRCVQYFGIYFIITGCAVISIGVSETHSLVSNFTYSGLSFISCGAFLLLAHRSMKGLRSGDGSMYPHRERRPSPFYGDDVDNTFSMEVTLEIVRDYISVAKRSGNAVIVKIHTDGHLTCELQPDDEVDPALVTACSIPDMDMNALDLNVAQLHTLNEVLRLIKRTCAGRQYEQGKVSTFEDDTIALTVWHGFDAPGNSRDLDAPPVYGDAVRIPVIREEEPPSYSDFVITMEGAL